MKDLTVEKKVLRGCVYRINRRGPRTEPCGTPHFKIDVADS